MDKYHSRNVHAPFSSITLTYLSFYFQYVESGCPGNGLCVLLTLVQFPRQCVTPEGLRSGQCCLSLTGAAEDECGSSISQGQCLSIAADYRRHGPQYPYSGRDRERWPLSFFKCTCHCNGNFSGYDCGRGRHGLTRPNCDQRISVCKCLLWQYFVLRKRGLSFHF